MRLDFFMLADSVAPAADDPGKITITAAGITYVVGPEVPVAVKQMACVARFLVEPEDATATEPFRVQLRLRAPDGSETGESTVLTILPTDLVDHDVHEEEERGIFFVVDLASARFAMPGLNRFELLLNDEIVGVRTLAVVLGDEPAPPPELIEPSPS